MKEQNSCFYDFGSFRIDAVKRQLLRDGKVLPLTSKAFATLLILVQRQGEIVTKEELMNTVWADTAVEENNLTQQISTLRKALGEQAKSPQFIITVPGQGYSFIAAVKENLNCQAENEGLSESIEVNYTKEEKNHYLKYRRSFKEYVRSYGLAAAILLLLVIILPYFFYSDLIASKRPAICVLPFKSLNNNEKSNIYSTGIPSYVTAKIGNLPNMIVRPANAEISQKYFGQEQNIVEVGQENNVDTVLTGSTLCDGENVQVIVHLWDVKNKRQIWAKVYIKNASDAIDVQEAISEEIISVINKKLLNS